VRSGRYGRQMVDEYGLLHRIRIQRVRCRECHGSHALLYDFLIPYRKYSVKALEAAVRGYVAQPSSYLEALTAVVNESATLFGAVRSVLCHLPLIWMHLQRQAIAAGAAARFSVSGGCPNSYKCRDEKKRDKLDWLTQVLELFPDLFERASAEGYPLFASGRGCELLRTHSAECALF
jgi:hypothetical protein